MLISQRPTNFECPQLVEQTRSFRTCFSIALQQASCCNQTNPFTTANQECKPSQAKVFMLKLSILAKDQRSITAKPTERDPSQPSKQIMKPRFKHSCAPKTIPAKYVHSYEPTANVCQLRKR
jgi:hypothetical protein